MAAFSRPDSTSNSAGASPDVVVIGAGIVGLGVAWRLRQRGVAVTVLDQGEIARGASHVAGGMLAACAEAEPGEEALVRLGRYAQSLWPSFAAELESIAGHSVELRTEGTMVMAVTADDRATLGHHLAFQQSLGLPVEWLSGAEARKREPHLAPGMIGAAFSPEDHQVETRKLVAAIRVAAERAGAVIRPNTPVASLVIEGERVTGVRLADGSVLPAGKVVLAAGAWARTIEGLPPTQRPPVRPIKGQVIVLAMDPAAPLLHHVVWAPGCYLVPRRDGRLLVGATVEEKGFDTTLTAGGIMSVLQNGWRALPGIEELPIVEFMVGHRPGCRDDAPVLGPAAVDGLVYATGHHRNGILLAPVTADSIARLVIDGVVDPEIAPFGMERFATARAH
ncbi:Glycine oxidase ThiO [Rhodovulum sp. PH10]|uniref:glycine oxidase ThiO n=1 Tax=Rhodovulum sp. PH10 TaxID=1187851 RepID=UPI00027C2791|nr:glycine oxidase ThiO [Rhodovulum sp. PH10]EJW12152.1 Glycine oxidase ThiO [Rhodovulum sp. PH10]